jgi:hypothetical protein
MVKTTEVSYVHFYTVNHWPDIEEGKRRALCSFKHSVAARRMRAVEEPRCYIMKPDSAIGRNGTIAFKAKCVLIGETNALS